MSLTPPALSQSLAPAVRLTPVMPLMVSGDESDVGNSGPAITCQVPSTVPKAPFLSVHSVRSTSPDPPADASAMSMVSLAPVAAEVNSMPDVNSVATLQPATAIVKPPS